MNLHEVDFGNEAGDDAASEELTSYFVEQEAFHPFFAPTKRLLVATARRGVGKSALLQWIGYKVEQDQAGDLVISSRGADLVRSKFGLTSKLTAPNEYIHDWMVRICSLVNRALALEIGFAVSDDSITLVESAELEGYKNRNLVGCLIDRLQTLLEKGRTSTKILARSDIELLKRNRKGKDRRVWLIVDDLDATYQKTDEETISLGAFFSACRYLTRDVKGLNIRVSLRTDVFPLVRRYDEATGKLDQYREEISWHQDDFLKLLAYRIRAMTQQESGNDKKITAEYLSVKQQEALIDQVFTARMEWNNKSVATYKVIYTLSYERPRWAIQLCKLAQKAALRNKKTIITREEIDEVWGDYGAKRIDDLVSEHKHQCPEIHEVLTGFRGAERQMTRDTLLDWIKRHITSHVTVIIDGKAVKEPVAVAHFLYRIGFIVARSEDGGEYEHYRFDQMPDFYHLELTQTLM